LSLSAKPEKELKKNEQKKTYQSSEELAGEGVRRERREETVESFVRNMVCVTDMIEYFLLF